MPFYLRKSVSVGPLRFNLSKSGVGVSAGIPGFRVGSGPRGNYVHMGRGGLYYRQSLGPSSGLPTQTTPPLRDGLEEVESTATAQMIDARSATLLDELNTKRRKVVWWPVVFIIVVLLVFSVLPLSPLAAGSIAAIGSALTWLVYQRDQVRTTTVLCMRLRRRRPLGTKHSTMPWTRSPRAAGSDTSARRAV
jgi:hypothetical protein